MYHVCIPPSLKLSSSLGCGARRGRACTLGANLGASRAPWRMLCAFKSPKLARTHGIAFRRARAEPSNRNLTFLIVWLCDLLLVYISCLYHTVPQALKLSTLWQPRCNSSRTSSSSHCWGHGRSIMRVRVKAMCPVDLGSRTHNREKMMLRRGQGDIKPHLLPRDFKSNRAATVAATTAVQQQYNSTSASNPGVCDSLGAFRFIRCVRCSPGDISYQVHAPDHDHICFHVRTINKKQHTSSNLILPYSSIHQYSE